MERCYIVYWEEQQLKKICIDCQSLDQAVPDAELIPLARFIFSMGVPQLPMCNRGCSPSLLREPKLIPLAQLLSPCWKLCSIANLAILGVFC